MQTVQVKEQIGSVERLYTYYLEGLVVVKVTNTQAGQTVQMPWRSHKPRAVKADKKGQFIVLGKHKHYI